MKIVIDIPEEFENHFERDRFDDSLCRLRTDAHCVAGKYEKELCDMLIEAFNNGTPLPKGHGRLGDLDKIWQVLKESEAYYQAEFLKESNVIHQSDINGRLYGTTKAKFIVQDAPTIIEADGKDE